MEFCSFQGVPQGSTLVEEEMEGQLDPLHNIMLSTMDVQEFLPTLVTGLFSSCIRHPMLHKDNHGETPFLFSFEYAFFNVSKFWSMVMLWSVLESLDRSLSFTPESMLIITNNVLRN